MSLKLYYHPLASFCWKVLIALYENETKFTPVLVDLGDAQSRAAFAALWPLAKMPVLRDEGRDETVPETSTILDYLDCYHPGRVRFTPRDPELAWRTRLWDRFFDLHVQVPMQKIVGDRRRAAEQHDPLGVAEAQAQLVTAYSVLERELANREWTSGPEFGLADCAAAPALFYANKVAALGAEQPRIKAYLERLQARPSFARVLAEAEPYFQFFPSK